MAGKGKASKTSQAAFVPGGSGQQKYAYPSHYGSHKSMVVRENEDGTVVCQDEFGEYTTPKDRLDSGLSDPNRYATSRLGKLLSGKEKKDDKR